MLSSRLSGVAGLAVTVIAICVALTAVLPAFGGPANVDSVGFGWAVLVIVALSQAVVLSAGDMSLAVGPIAGLTVITASALMESYGVEPQMAIAVALGVGLLCGATNGWLIGRTGLSSFVVTLATGSIYAGVTLGVTSGMPYYRLPASFLGLGSTTFAGLPLAVLLAFAVAGLLWGLFRYVGLGRQFLAVGANPRAARLLGVPVTRTRVVVHGLSGILAGLAGLVLAARIGAGQPSIGGEWLLASFAAPIIGGTALGGGVISVGGTVLGALLLAVLTNALTFLGVTAYWAQLPAGLVILAAVSVDRARALLEDQRERQVRTRLLLDEDARARRSEVTS